MKNFLFLSVFIFVFNCSEKQTTPKNIISIANRVQNLCSNLATSLDHAGIKILHNQFFDTLRIFPNNKWEIAAENEKMNFRKFKDGSVGISIDESTTEKDVLIICQI